MPGTSPDVPGISLFASQVRPGQLRTSATRDKRNRAGASQLPRLKPYRGSSTTVWNAPWPVPT